MSETEAQRAVRIADKYVAPDGEKPKRPKKGKGAGKPLYSSGEGTKYSEIFTPKPRSRGIIPSRKHIMYSDELFAAIIDRVSCGETIFDICEDEDMPDRHTFIIWTQRDSNLNAMYARAQHERSYIQQEELLDIADNATIEEVNKARLKIDTRKWIMGKVNRHYADEKAIERREESRAVYARVDPRMLSESARNALREECRRIIEERDANTIDVTPSEEKQA